MIEERLPTVSGMVIEVDGGLLTTEERRYITATATGLTIRDDCPFEVWSGFVARLMETEKRTLWYLGDLANFGERRYGEMYSQALETTEYAYQTLRDAAWVAGRIELSRRRDNLGFSIHKEVAALDPADADELLDRYVAEGWTQKRLREEGKARKNARAREEALAAPVPTSYHGLATIEVADARCLPLDGGSVDLVVTSPPCNLGKRYEADASADDWASLMRDSLAEIVRVLKVGGRLAINVPLDTTRGGHRPLYVETVRRAIEAGLTYRFSIVWREGTVSRSTARGSLDSAHAIHVVAPVEMIAVLHKGTWRVDPEGKTGDLAHDEWLAWTNGDWEVAGESRPWEGFEAAFPSEIPYRLVRMLSFKEDVVLDPFGGSFTTAAVAARLGRRVYSYDTDGRQVASGKRRLAAHDGLAFDR
jgi:site-specific DNA-methyltransferase (adenine-specific)